MVTVEWRRQVGWEQRMGGSFEKKTENRVWQKTEIALAICCT